MPAYLNGHPDGMLIEAPAGLLDGDDHGRDSAADAPFRLPAYLNGHPTAC